MYVSNHSYYIIGTFLTDQDFLVFLSVSCTTLIIAGSLPKMSRSGGQTVGGVGERTQTLD